MRSRPSERVAVVGTIDPDANAAATFGTDIIDMSKFDSVMFVIMAGTLGSSAGVSFLVQEDTDSGMSTPTTITGKSITELTDAGTDSDKQAIVNVRSDELSANHRYIRGVMTVSTATSDSAVIALGLDPRHGPANDFDLASVDEIVS